MGMSAEQRVRAFLATFHAGKLDLAEVGSHLAAGARYQPIVPMSAPVFGRERICGELDRQYQIYADCDCQILAIASSGKHVFTERVDRVRQLATGGETVIHVTGVFEVDDDGLIASWREYWDAIDCARQIGVTMDQMEALMKTDAAEAA